MGLNKVGGILMLIGLFLPALLIIIEGVTVFLWMFGLAYTSGYISWGLDIIGLPFFILILVFSILCIVKDAGKTKVFGILSMVFAIIYYILWYLVGRAIANMAAGYGVQVTILVIPFIGFFLILIGSILNIAAK